ncbi:MAG: hypothetical protein ACJ74O_08305 [Frankiaceae bacterium]
MADAGAEPAAGLAAELAARRTDLERELGDLSAPAGDQSGISFGKRVGEGTSLAVERLSQVAAHDRLQAMLADVRRAEAKLAEGSYGSCDRCGATSQGSASRRSPGRCSASPAPPGAEALAPLISRSSLPATCQPHPMPLPGWRPKLSCTEPPSRRPAQGGQR